MKADAAITLSEHTWSLGVALSPEEASTLARSPAGVEVRPSTRPGYFDLRASSIVGTLVLESRPVVIRPKVPVERLLWMLDVVGHVWDLGPEAPFDEDTDLLSSMQARYAQLLGRALSLGPVREYVATEDDLQTLRGTPDLLNIATRRFGLFPPVRCSFDEFSVDTEVNRLLLAAALVLARWRRTDDARRLEYLASRLEGVREVRYRADRVPEPRVDRRHAHVVPALRMAQLVLRRASFEFREGRIMAMSFLIDMNRLYEEFVIEGLRRVLGLTTKELVAHPTGLFLDAGRRFRLLPDGLWRGRDGRPLVVLDAKYKRGEAAVREDVYQMVAYAAALQLDRAVLLYADVPPDDHQLVHGPRVLIERVALDGSRGEIAGRIAETAARIAAFVGVSATRPRPEALDAGAWGELAREAFM